MLKKIYLSLIISAVLWINNAAAQECRIGVNAHFKSAKTVLRWEPVAEHISEYIAANEDNKDFYCEILPLPLSDLLAAVERGEVDFILANPVQSTITEKKYATVPLANVNNIGGGPQFAGVILVRADSGIKSLEDLKGKRATSMKFGVAAGGYLFQAYHLYKAGYKNIHDGFFSDFTESETQPHIIQAVRRGGADVGFVRTGMLEGMAEKGQVEMSDFLILDRKEGNYPYPHSTDLYPSWFFSATKSADPALAQLVKKALLDIKNDSGIAKRAKIEGFVEALPLKPLQEMMQALKIAPFDK